MRDKAEMLMNEAARDSLGFTLHDISHSDALWETADLVCGSAETLTPAEAYVLGCSFILHDAAMTKAAYKDGLPTAVGELEWRDMLSVTYFNVEGHWPSEDELNSPSKDVLNKCYMRAIRETHPRQAERLVDEHWETSAGSQILLIEETTLRESYGPLIGQLAVSHWWDVGVLEEKFRREKGSLPSQPREWKINPLKLACILRLADAIQIDSGRAPTFLFALRQPQGESFLHWQFQEHMSRPQLHDDRVTFTSLRPFPQNAAEAWWLALGYLREVDQELKKVDALLHDLGRTRLAARAVAGVDSEERFESFFPVIGWRPVDAVVRISDTVGLVNALGGQQLYGTSQEVAVRELLQNAHDAVLARQTIDHGFSNGRIDVLLTTKADDEWVLEVRDNGIGMDEDILIHGLLDFGRSGWTTDHVRRKFHGLAGGGFQPKGRFGIGFYSVFMLGAEVTITTRRYDGASGDSRRLQFSGLAQRPVLTTPAISERVPQGTSIRILLKSDPYGSGIFARLGDGGLDALIKRLALENSIPIHTSEVDDRRHEYCDAIEAFSLGRGSAEEVFDRLYPPRKLAWQKNDEQQRLAMREEFSARATRVLDDTGRSIGHALLRRSRRILLTDAPGMVVVGGFRAEEVTSIVGYFEGMPSRASRDKVDLAATAEQVARWIKSQEQVLRDAELFDRCSQIDLSGLFFQAFGELAGDHCVAMAGDTLTSFGDVEVWAAGHDEIFVASGWPLLWVTYGPEPRLWHYPAGVEAMLPENWIVASNGYFSRPFDELFPWRGDERYAEARAHREPTWEKRWWNVSDSVKGSIIRQICNAWGCDVGDVLAPVAERHWDDQGTLLNMREPIDGYWLRRPRST